VSRLAAVTAAAVLAALVAGCGGGSSAPATSTAPEARPPGLDAAACRRLTPAVRAAIAQAGGRRRVPLRRSAQPSPRLSACIYLGPGTQVTVHLDTAYRSRRRFFYRTDEAIQFSFDDPQRRPRAVPGVGDGNVEDRGATWTPASRELLAIRGNRLLILDLYVRGAGSEASKLAAARLARRVYGLSA
jgi:hypothetical protein